MGDGGDGTLARLKQESISQTLIPYGCQHMKCGNENKQQLVALVYVCCI